MKWHDPLDDIFFKANKILCNNCQKGDHKNCTLDECDCGMDGK